MKKSEQKAVNLIVSEAQKIALDLLNNNHSVKGEKLGYMNANVFSFPDVKVLVSYDTPVAMVKESTGFDFMRMNSFRKKATVSYPYEYEWVNYSNATARQISRFFNLYAKNYYTYREV